eukprot:TRINITY_DN6926_c0_g3_i1.p1 TRINITY_DN6926_c0_g3~~TRINITY_DN6926_c0_g3_i1.p1  ORF type:complete len:147 (-),score=13.05 TRINITY_DN6926_c0_g3_i1:1900-2340(-)
MVSWVLLKKGFNTDCEWPKLVKNSGTAAGAERDAGSSDATAVNNHQPFLLTAYLSHSQMKKRETIKVWVQFLSLFVTLKLWPPIVARHPHSVGVSIFVFLQTTFFRNTKKKKIPHTKEYKKTLVTELSDLRRSRDHTRGLLKERKI